MEQAFADYDAAQLPEDSMIIFRNNILGVLGAKGGQRWCRERQVWFSESFCEHVDRLLAAPRAESVTAGVNLPQEPGEKPS